MLIAARDRTFFFLAVLCISFGQLSRLRRVHFSGWDLQCTPEQQHQFLSALSRLENLEQFGCEYWSAYENHDNDAFFWDMFPRFDDLHTLAINSANVCADVELETRALSQCKSLISVHPVIPQASNSLWAILDALIASLSRFTIQDFGFLSNDGAPFFESHIAESSICLVGIAWVSRFPLRAVLLSFLSHFLRLAFSFKAVCGLIDSQFCSQFCL